MKLEIASPKFLCYEDLKQEIRTFNMPALLVGNDFRVIAKNKDFADSKAFRIGSRFDKFLNPSDRERFYRIAEGTVFIADLTNDESKGYATIIRGIDCYLVCLRYLADSLCDRIAERFSELSGYDVGVNAYISAAVSDIGNSQVGKALSSVISRLLAELYEVHRLSFFDFSATASSLFCALDEIAPSVSRRINMPRTLPETIALGNGNDMLLVLACLMSLCLGCAGEGNIGFSAVDCENGIKISVSCEVKDGYGETESFVNALYGRQEPNRPLDNASFWAFFAKLLADANLWDINARLQDERVELNIFMPSVERGDEFYVRDVDFYGLRAVLQYFFC